MPNPGWRAPSSVELQGGWWRRIGQCMWVEEEKTRGRRSNSPDSAASLTLPLSSESFHRLQLEHCVHPCVAVSRKKRQRHNKEQKSRKERTIGLEVLAEMTVADTGRDRRAAGPAVGGTASTGDLCDGERRKKGVRNGGEERWEVKENRSARCSITTAPKATSHRRCRKIGGWEEGGG